MHIGLLWKIRNEHFIQQPWNSSSECDLFLLFLVGFLSFIPSATLCILKFPKFISIEVKGPSSVCSCWHVSEGLLSFTSEIFGKGDAFSESPLGASDESLVTQGERSKHPMRLHSNEKMKTNKHHLNRLNYVIFCSKRVGMHLSFVGVDNAIFG